MLTIKAEIKRSELKVDGTYNVKIRFTLDRKVKRLSTNLFVTQQDLTKSLKFKEDTSIKREIDRLVLYYREQCLKLQLDQNHYSLDETDCWTNEALCPNSLYTHNHASPKFLKMRILKPAGQLEHLLSSHLSAGESANLSFNPNALRYSCGYYIYALLHILI